VIASRILIIELVRYPLESVGFINGIEQNIIVRSIPPTLLVWDPCDALALTERTRPCDQVIVRRARCRLSGAIRRESRPLTTSGAHSGPHWCSGQNDPRYKRPRLRVGSSTRQKQFPYSSFVEIASEMRPNAVCPSMHVYCAKRVEGSPVWTRQFLESIQPEKAHRKVCADKIVSHTEEHATLYIVCKRLVERITDDLPAP
jgi:hypothetical protein